MRHFRSTTTFAATATMLLLWSGCAYMNTTALDDMIPVPSRQFSDDRQLLAELKLDPMASTLAQQIEESENSFNQAMEVASAEIPNSEGLTNNQILEFPVNTKSDSMLQIQDATPVQDPNQVTPIILKAVKRSPERPKTTPMQPLPKPEIPVEHLPMSSGETEHQELATENNPLPTLQATADESLTIQSLPPGLPGNPSESHYAEPLTPAPSRENRLLPVPVNQFPTDAPLQEMPINQDIATELPSAAYERSGLHGSESDFDQFISDQMQFLIPPFADHPTDVQCISEECDDANELVTNPDLSRVYHDVPEFVSDEAALHHENRSNDFTTPDQPSRFNGNELETRSSGATQLAAESASETSDEADNYFVGSRISSNEESTTQPEFETQSAELPIIAGPKSDWATAPAKKEAVSDSEKITWQRQLNRTIEAFEEEIESTEDDIEANNLESGLAILKALKRRMRPDEDSPEEIRNYWTHQIQAINDLLNHPSTSNDSRVAASALEELRLAVHHLQVIADLKVFNAVICKSVSGYGQYIPFGNNEFVPRQTILVYCEIDNFAPLLETVNGQTTYQTRLSSSFTVRNAEGTVVQHQDFPVVTDNARNLRRDFFMHLPVTFSELEPGTYDLQISVRDHGSGKLAELDRSLKLTIR